VSKPDFELFIAMKPESKARPRFNTRTGNAYTPTKTHKYEFAIRERWQHKYGLVKPWRGPVSIEVRFLMPRPQAIVWKTKPMPRSPHAKRPDLDNLLKAVTDALNGVAYVDDAQVFKITATKAYAAGNEPPSIWIGLWEHEG
jgi:Holliday junction resolvase RusA-like endonuclease